MTVWDANVFVLGDLILDHYIPVVDKPGHIPTENERRFDGRNRRTIPGGAANSARLLASLNRGRTVLWGLSGYSPWGEFAQILKRSYARGAGAGIAFRGAHSNAHQMNTITRVVRTDAEGKRHREFRIDDVDAVPVTESQRQDALAYVSAEISSRKPRGIDAIIINDFDMGSLDDKLVRSVVELAEANSIPVFVDPKRTWAKYRDIHVTCATPNLHEWCHLVGEAQREDDWRHAVQLAQGLDGMARRSLRHMPKVDCHVIKCDKDGLVVIAPSTANHRSITVIRPPTTPESPTPGQQLGAGDVLIAAMTMEYLALRRDNQAPPFSKSLNRAAEVVACYYAQEWHEVPTEHDLQDFKCSPPEVIELSPVAAAVLLLPDSQTVPLDDYSVRGSGLVSRDEPYRTVVNDLVASLIGGWQDENVRSVIVTGRGGVGKSEVATMLEKELSPIGVSVWADGRHLCSGWTKTAKLQAYVAAEVKRRHETANAILLIIDEAFSTASHLLDGENGKNFLQELGRGKTKVRCLFIDADYQRHKAGLSQSQFRSRCDLFELPSLGARPQDIPYIFAKACLTKLGHASILISETVLLAAISDQLATPEAEQSPRNIVAMAGQVTTSASAGPPTLPVQLSRRHLPERLRRATETENQKLFYRFEVNVPRAPAASPARKTRSGSRRV